MKKLLLSSVALFGVTATAMAADLPRRTVVAPAPVPYVAVPVFTWTGFYIGGNAGYGFDTRDRNDDTLGFNNFGSGLSVQTNAGLAPVVPLSGFNNLGFGGFDNRREREGFVGGGQVGYNFQFTPGSGFVIGIEADAQFADFGRRRNDDFFGGFGGFGNNGIFTAATVLPNGAGSGILPPTGVGNGALGNVALFNGVGNGFGNSFDRRPIDWFGTVRGRLGYAIDRLLIYATGGLAFTDRDDDRNDFGRFGFGSGIASGASLVGTNFYTTPGAALVGSTVAPTNTGFFFDDRRNDNWGWTVGGGIEYALASGFLGFNSVSVKIEGLYVNFERDRKNNGFFSGGGNVVGVSNTGAAVVESQFAGFDNHRNRDDFAVVRAGLNFKFGGL
jgi:outer membrane immunogenic protein